MYDVAAPRRRASSVRSLIPALVDPSTAARFELAFSNSMMVVMAPFRALVKKESIAAPTAMKNPTTVALRFDNDRKPFFTSSVGPSSSDMALLVSMMARLSLAYLFGSDDFEVLSSSRRNLLSCLRNCPMVLSLLLIELSRRLISLVFLRIWTSLAAMASSSCAISLAWSPSAAISLNRSSRYSLFALVSSRLDCDSLRISCWAFEALTSRLTRMVSGCSFRAILLKYNFQQISHL